MGASKLCFSVNEKIQSVRGYLKQQPSYDGIEDAFPDKQNNGQGRGTGRSYKELDLVKRAAAAAGESVRTPGPCGLGGRDPEKKGWANLARALAARCEYLFWLCCTGAGGGGGGGAGDVLPRVGNRGRSDMLQSRGLNRAVDQDLTRNRARLHGRRRQR